MGPSPRTLSVILHTVLLDNPDAPYQDKAFRRLPAPWPAPNLTERQKCAGQYHCVPHSPSYIAYNTVAEIHQTAGYSTFCHKISRQHKRGIAIMDTESRAVNIR